MTKHMYLDLSDNYTGNENR